MAVDGKNLSAAPEFSGGQEIQTSDTSLPRDHADNWLLMLDVDGTLLDIAHRPEAVTVPVNLKETLLRLYCMLEGALVLVSGRSVADLDRLFAPMHLPCIGLHGGERRLGKQLQNDMAKPMREQLSAIVEECRQIGIRHPELVLETKTLSVALHYRHAPHLQSSVHEETQRISQRFGTKWKLLEGKMVYEILPGRFSKAQAVRQLIALRKFSGRKPVYVGDDVTDDGALMAVKDEGGYAVKVGEGRLDAGMWCAADSSQVRRWLADISSLQPIHATQPLLSTMKHHLPRKDSRIIAVSNRVTPGRGRESTGGLAVAINSVLQSHGGVWLGWSGKVGGSQEPQVQKMKNMTFIVRDLDEKQHHEFYEQFCNAVLWPLLHYNTSLPEFSYGAYETYRKVNNDFADLIEAQLKPNDIIWVHDFHFIPLAAALRERGVVNKIGFFLHTPFPSREVLLTMPVHRSLMATLFSYNVVGFQTQHDVEEFRAYARSEQLRQHAGFPASPETVIGHFPISIQTEKFTALSKKSLAAPEAKDLETSLRGRKLILGVDRLDHSKGIPQRIKAMDEMLSHYPDVYKECLYLQIAPPTREGVETYKQLRAEVESLVGHTNGKHADVDWMPIRFIARGVRRELLSAFYRIARVCLVTPLRDGMNLVAKEFVAAQNPADPGVLVLSRFAGAAEEMQQALLVNPHDVEEMANIIHQALNMPLGERRQRHEALLNTISKHTLEDWYQEYLGALMDEY